jgi:hypothetical protein
MLLQDSEPQSEDAESNSGLGKKRQPFGPSTGSHTRHSGHESRFEPVKDGINAKNAVAKASSCYGVAIFIQ